MAAKKTALDPTPLFTKTFDFTVWLMQVSNHFPRSQRFIVTQRFLDAALNFQELVLEANVKRMPERLEKLLLADVQLDKVRIYLRLTLRLEWLTPGQYKHSAAMVAEMGRLLGGWQRALRKNKDQAPGASDQDETAPTAPEAEPVSPVLDP
ncbi:MAG: diversity-generating retroelement protein Avd [Anaerolinea sp.]|nr:diversity-generating retroelement protein Avd [Anaerolinea sp.]